MGSVKSKICRKKTIQITTAVVNNDNKENGGGEKKCKQSKNRKKQKTCKTVNTMSDFEEEVLNRSNELRAKHNAPPLQLNANLTSYAQEWANHLASLNRMEHRSENTYGENLYQQSRIPPPVDVSGIAAVDSWYSEIELYPDFSEEPNMNNFSEWGHFTQLVWIGTQRMGVAYAYNSTQDTVYIVANYDPPGNVVGQFTANVLHPSD